MRAWVLSRPSGVPDPIQVDVVSGVAPAAFAAGIFTPDAADSSNILVVPPTGGAFTIAAPSNLSSGQPLTIMIRNTTGGALGATTWNAIYKLASWTNPATGFNRSVSFANDGVHLYEINRTASDIPN